MRVLVLGVGAPRGVRRVTFATDLHTQGSIEAPDAGCGWVLGDVGGSVGDMGRSMRDMEYTSLEPLPWCLCFLPPVRVHPVAGLLETENEVHLWGNVC